jgi:2-amino-4-hydroxy-6-hydroxymethyldihydropteridine diphosphokinase
MSQPLVLPPWAQVGEKRLAHIARVTALLDQWAEELRLTPADAQAWHDAGRWHDALRDAPEAQLRALTAGTPFADVPPSVLHGPAAAAMLERDGETRAPILLAVRWHTLGNPAWDRTGRALFMADFLEPGRNFMRADRAFLVSALHADFDGVFRQVVRMRLDWTLREGKSLYPETVGLWNSVC